MAQIPDFNPLTTLAAGDLLTGWDVSEGEMFKITFDNFITDLETYFQVIDTNLTNLAALSPDDGNIIVGSGAAWGLEPIGGAVVIDDDDLTISARGTYIFNGSVAGKTFTLDDGIVGEVWIYNDGTVDFTYSGSLSASVGDGAGNVILSPGERSVRLLWNGVDQYTN